MTKYRVNVPVRVDFLANGEMRPRQITWEDGHIYEIDRIIAVQQAAALKAGGQGDRYTVRINGQITYLFFERDATDRNISFGKWFVERR